MCVSFTVKFKSFTEIEENVKNYIDDVSHFLLHVSDFFAQNFVLE